MSKYHIKMKGGSLCFYGDWFGRPYDNYHRIEDAILDNETLFIHFDAGELLTVEKPCGIINENNSFIIQSASFVVWEYIPYGSNQRIRKQHKYIPCSNGEITKFIDGVQTYIFGTCTFGKNQSAVQCFVNGLKGDV